MTGSRKKWDATLYIGEVENRYLTKEVRRKVYGGWYKLPYVEIDNRKVLLKDGQVFHVEGIKVECMMVLNAKSYDKR